MGGRSSKDVLGRNKDHRLSSPSMFRVGKRGRHIYQFQLCRGQRCLQQVVWLRSGQAQGLPSEVRKEPDAFDKG